MASVRGDPFEELDTLLLSMGASFLPSLFLLLLVSLVSLQRGRVLCLQIAEEVEGVISLA